MTIDTTKLRELAQKADQGEGHHLYTHPRDTDNWEANVEYIAAANPAVVLALLDVIEMKTLFPDEITLKNLRKKLGLPDSCAERRILCAIDRLLAIESAAQNLKKAKGRHNSEIAMNQLLETLK